MTTTDTRASALLADWQLACDRQPVIDRYLPDERRQRLFACACCRRIWHLLKDERSRRAVKVAERFADGLATRAELAGARKLSAWASSAAASSEWAVWEAWAAWAAWASSAASSEWASAASSEWAAASAERASDSAADERTAQVRILLAFAQPDWTWDSRWTTATVQSLATRIYAERDWASLPILADALEEVGCDAEIVNELRTRDEWFIGDWILDRARGMR